MTQAPQRGWPADSALLGALLDALPLGVALAGRDERFVRVNAEFAHLTGLDPAAHVGRLAGEVLGPYAVPVLDDARRVLATGEPIVDHRVSGELPDAPGVVRYARTSFLPLRDAAGEVVGVLAFITDTTARVRAAEEREQALAEARHAREVAESANQAKTAFLAMMSHEIRTPINAIMGYAELLSLELSGPLTEKQRAQLARVSASSRHLLSLVNDVLDLAKVESGRLYVVRERAAACDAVVAALGLVHPQAEAREILVANHCNDHPGVCYMGDPHRVEQVLVNLLSNAVRFTAPGGRVTVSCELTEDPSALAHVAVGTSCVCAIMVEDTGVGISAEHLGTVFEPFVQVESGHTRTREGTGLGLAISRRLARLMGGDLTVESREGMGSTFTLWLPGVPSVEVAADGCVIPERREAVRHARGLRQVSEALLQEMDALVGRYIERLRHDPALPTARGLSEADLVDHTPTLLVDMAQALAIVEESGGAPSQLMRDGSEIQRVIADRHGHQRRQVGFSEAELLRDFALLEDELMRVVRGRAAGLAGLAEALTLLEIFVARAREASVAAYRRGKD